MAAPDLAGQDPVDRVLERLVGVCRSGDGWKARCPAHEDHTPSLSVGRGNDDRVVLFCQVGCETSDIVAAIGFELRDLFRDRRDRPHDVWRSSGDRVAGPRPTPEAVDQPAKARRRHVETYSYVDENGVELFQKLRYEPKDFRVRRPDGVGGWVWKIGDAGRVLYRLLDVRAAVAAGRPILLVEGEKDADRAATELGMAATCNYEGAAKDGQRPKWRPEYSDALAGAHVLIVQDRDETGAAHAAAAYRDLRGKAASVRIVQSATIGPKHDLSDHLDAGHSIDELVPVVPPSEPEPAGAEPQEVEDSRVAQLRDDDRAIASAYTAVDWDALFAADDIAPDWLIPEVLERGESVVIYAPAKIGKSLITLDMIAALASGGPRLGRPAAAPLRVVCVDMENSLRDLHRRLVDLNYTPAQLRTLIYLSFPGLPGLDTRQGGAELAALVRHHAADVVVLDSTSRVVEGDEDAADTYRAMYRHTIRLLKPLGTTIIRLDNSGKDTSRGQRGSSAKGDDIDAAWEFTKQRGGTFRLKCTLQRSGVHPDVVHIERQTEPLRHLLISSPGPASAESLHPAINALIDALDQAGAPNDVGRDRARSYLGEDTRAGNSDLGEAVKARKRRGLGTAPDDGGADGVQRAFEDGWGP